MKKTLPELNFQAAALFSLPYEAIKWEILKTALELQIFDNLIQPDTASNISARLSTHPGNTEHLLNALTAMGCLFKNNGVFSNTPAAETFLTSGKDTSIGASLLFMQHWDLPALNGGMKKLVQNGPPEMKDVSDEKLWAAGAEASLNYSRCGRAQLLSELVASLPEFPSFNKMLDMGAGPGIIGAAVTLRHPTLECVLFDQPPVCEVADKVIAEYGLEDRVRTMPGDYMNDPIGDGYDFVMANLTLNFCGPRLDKVLSKVFQALNPGGVFMAAGDGLSKEQTAPAASVISWLSSKLTGIDMSFDRETVADAAMRVGFVSTQIQVLEEPVLSAHGR